MDVDMLVVGAGPAGVAAALEGHARGLEVLLVDKATFPRDKTCGDGLTAGALRLLEGLGVDTPGVGGYERVHETVLVSPSGREVRLLLPAAGHYSAVVPRADLDAALVERARRAGVATREAAGVEALTEDDGAVVATLAGGDTVLARFVVAADGHYSTLRRLREPGGPADLGSWHAFRQYFVDVDDTRQWVLFEPDLLPGYAWVFPLPGGRANVGYGVRREPGLTGARLKQLWRDVLERPAMRRVLGPRAEPEGRTTAWPIPTDYDAARLADGRVLYVGDAARVVDPMTGEGIAQALESGMLAAHAVARGGEPDVVSACYRRLVDRAIGRDVRFGGLLSRVLSSPLGARGAIRAAGLTAWTRRSFARWMFEDYPRAMLLTPDRWHPRMLTGSGAYRGGH